MKRSEKQSIIENLTQEINSYNHFYLTDIEALNAQKTSALRALCFQQNVKLIVVKNTLLRKAFEASDKNLEELYGVLQGNTSLMFSETANLPAKMIKDFRKKQKVAKPLLKGAYAEECVYVGENQLDALVDIKSKEQLLGEVIGLLQSPAQKLISALQSGQNTITGVLKTLSDKE
jgi:large subunit ribosomal protein L10